MKYLKFLSVVCLSLFFVTQSSFAQNEMMNDKKMDKDKMGNEMMEKDSMNNNMIGNDNMIDKDMMHHDMMMRIDKDMNGVAIKGYDPVAYFTDGKAVMGKSDYSYKWNDAKWHFTSSDHLKMFKENPDKYAPQYGGFCAYGVTKDHCGTTDPTAWKIVDGKLYLTTNSDVKMMWEKDIQGNIKKGDENWMMLNKEK
jgi:pentapeptide MXKDX repeat protein